MIGLKFHLGLKRVLQGVAAAAAIGWGLTVPATAQSGAAGFAEMNVHDYLHRDIVLFAQALGMDDGQRVIVESLYEDYRAEFDAGWARTQQKFADMRDELQAADRTQVMNLVLAPFEAWQREKAAIKDQFEQNVQVILNAQQLQQWPAFQRQVLREKTLHYGRLSGEAVNLFHVLRDLRLSDRMRMAIDPTVEQYDLALHQALEQRNAALRESQTAMMRSIRNQEQPQDISHVERDVQRRVALRNVNDQYIDLIAAELPGELAEEFRANALERAYPRVFRPLPAQRVFEEAVKLEGLDGDVLAKIDSLHQAMLSELVAINARLHQGVRDHEPKAMINQAEISAARQAGDTVARLTDPNLKEFRERDERASYYVAQLRDLLGVEQFATLPGASRWVPQRRAQVVDPAGSVTREDERGSGGTLTPRGSGVRGPARGRDE